MANFGGELRFLDAGDELILVDAWNSAPSFAENAREVAPREAVALLSRALRTNRALSQALRELLTMVEGSALTLRGLSEHALLQRVAHELTAIAPSLRVLRVPRVGLTVPTPPDLPHQEDAPDANELSFIDFDLMNQDGEPIPFLNYEVEFPEPGIVKRGRLDQDGHLHIGEIPAGSYKIKFPEIDFVVEPDPNTAFVDVELVDTAGRPVAGEAYVVTLPDGQVIEGKLDVSGRAHVSGLPVDAVAKVTFPNLAQGGVSAAPAEPAEETEPVIENPAHMVRMTGMFFDTNKCFLLPSDAMFEGMRKLVSVYQAHAQGQILVVGHTDTSGEPAYNNTLSLERAKSAIAFLTDDVDAWLKLYESSMPEKKRWGATEDRAMFLQVTGNELTPQALKDYQAKHGLKNDGLIGPKSRRQLISDYMASDGTSLPAGITPIAHGCGESFPASNTGDGQAEQRNRRVEMFVFEDKVDPKPAGEISKVGNSDYAAWLARVVETVDLGAGAHGTQTEERLETTFALDEVTLLATEFTEYGFGVWMTRIFGEDIPVSAYSALYASLRDKSFKAPSVVLVDALPGGHVAGYNLQAHQIEITRDAVRRARDDNEACWTVMAALVEEMGHHIDDHLRNTLSDVGGDAQLDEGAAFGYALVNALTKGEARVTIGTHHDQGASHKLTLDLSDFREHIEDVLGEWQQREDARTDHYEYFGAGEGNHANPGHSFGHASIERALARPFFNKERATTPTELRELKEIYFGNWLRDYSQALTDKTLRPPGASPDAAGYSADALTKVMDVLARQHFEDIPVFRVTQEKLGVYRYEEHIDNPLGLPDGAALEPRLNTRPLAEETEANPRSWLMKYIDGNVAGRKSAVTYMSEQLRLAVANGRTSEGRRHFGAALHVLEDYYAHSNFVELALRSRGHTNVFPWSGVVPMEGGSVTPVVTGMFGADDTAASLMYVIGEHMAKDANCTPGRRGPGADIALILLRDRDPEQAAQAEAAFSSIESFQRANPKFFRAYCETMDFLLGWSGQLIGHGLHGGAALIDDAQTEFVSNVQTSTNPTHSQLAKDHDDHPLHVLAARCAIHAVGIVGKAMLDAWAQGASADHVVNTAKKFFFHPQHPSIANADADIRALIMIVDAWAKDPANAAAITRVSSASILQHLQTAPEHAAARQKTREVIREGQHLRHSTRPEAPPDAFDALIDDLLTLVGAK